MCLPVEKKTSWASFCSFLECFQCSVWSHRMITSSYLPLLRFTSCLSFYSILNELNDYAGQREVVAEEMAHKVYGELMRYSQDLKAERKHVSRRAAANRFRSFPENDPEAGGSSV